MKPEVERGYLVATLHPWPCFLFLLPLLAIYEAGVIWLGGPSPDTLRNGADAWLRWSLQSFGLPHLYCAPLFLVLLFLIWSMACWRDRPDHPLEVWLGMVAESAFFAVGLWLLSRNLGPMLDEMGVRLNWTLAQHTTGQVITFVGAGIYEEVIFRLLLCLALRGLLTLVATPGWISWPVVLVVSSLVFAAAHHIGPYGEPFHRFVFVFRALAGLYFSLLYQTRGFGIAVGAHAGYDVLVGVLMA
jgi:membrane protease YdiL (CAAX protease family)